MSKTRKHYSKSFKSQVVLEALKEREPLEVLAKKYELTPQQISTWKSQAIANISALFSKENKADKSKEVDIQLLYAQIGELKVQNDFLKKSCNKIQRRTNINDRKTRLFLNYKQTM